MHLLDTDTCTLLFEGNPLVVHNLEQLPDEEVGTTIVTKAEILRGRIEYLLKVASGEQFLRAHELLMRTDAFLTKMIVIPVDEQA